MSWDPTGSVRISPAAKSAIEGRAVRAFRAGGRAAALPGQPIRDRAIAREELLANVWRINPDGLPTRTIDMHVARLREKLRDDPGDPRCC